MNVRDLVQPALSGIRADCGPGPNLLVVSNAEQPHHAVRHLLTPGGWECDSAFACADAVVRLRARDFAVVLTEDRLDDGNWMCILDACAGLPVQPRVVVFSRLADYRLWAEVLNLGAYDLLTYPFDGDEIQRVSSLAAQSWKRERAAAAHPASLPRRGAGAETAPGHMNGPGPALETKAAGRG